MNNQVANRPKMSFTQFMGADVVQKRAIQILGEKKALSFTSSIISAVQMNPGLQECEPKSIFNAALLGESLNLSPSPQLGQYYLVPFNVKTGVDEKGKPIYGKQAQFQIGYKGLIQLAIRSGQYKKLNVLAIKKGELINYDPLNEEIEVNLIDDEVEREETETIGYYAMFEYTNGFRKSIYWSKPKMIKHAEKYSAGYKAHKGYTFWEKDFDGMAYKTMLRQLISKWGIMSVEMQTAFESDMAVLKDDGTKEYIDNPSNDNNVIIEEVKEEKPQKQQENEKNEVDMNFLD